MRSFEIRLEISVSPGTIAPDLEPPDDDRPPSTGLGA